MGGTAVLEGHLAQLCKASISLILIRFTPDDYPPVDPASQTVLSVLETFPRVVLEAEYQIASSPWYVWVCVSHHFSVID